MTKKQLYFYVKINFLILALFIVLVSIFNLRKKGLPKEINEALILESRKAEVTY